MHVNKNMNKRLTNSTYKSKNFTLKSGGTCLTKQFRTSN